MHIQPFIDYLQLEKRYSKHTLQSYTKDLEQFQVFCHLQYQLSDLDTVTFQHIRSWMVDLMNRKIVPKSINRKLSTLRSYYKFCQKKGWVQTNPTAGLQGPKMPDRLPTFVPEGDMVRLLDHVQFEDDFAGHRNKMILELFYSTGMRKAELIGLTLKDIDPYNGTVKVLGKRNKERLIPVTKSLLGMLDAYMEERSRVENASSTDVMFITLKARPIDPREIYTIVQKYLSAATTVHKKSPHTLRHTFATHMLNNGADINAIKEILGHSSLAATQVYTHNSFEKLKNIHKKAHPKG